MQDGYMADINRAPRRVQNAANRAWDVLRNHPPQPQPPKIKRLHGYSGLWRLRVSDSYRLVYRIDSNGRSGTITLLMLGDRKDIYDRLGANDDGTPGVRIVTGGLGGLIEREPTAKELIEVMTDPPVDTQRSPDELLPYELSAELLADWGVDTQFHQAFASAATESDLLALTNRVPPNVVWLVLNCIWPPSIQEVVQQPVRMVDDPDDIIASNGEIRELSSFLLKLDEDQKAFVGRFDREVPQGPWLLKGGPGSGKSVVALYCIRELIDRESRKLPGQQQQLRILLTTFTNSLVNASRHLLKAIGAIDSQHRIQIETLDEVVKQHLPDEMRQLQPMSQSDAKRHALKAIAECRKSNSSFGFSAEDAAYLLEEVDWVIVGQDLRTRDEYLEIRRTGRKRGLTKRQRVHVWAFYVELKAALRKDERCLFTERHQAALANVHPRYDYVFVDEAQDLRPVGVRFAVGLAKPTSNVFVTADSNQSIYATGMSWNRVAEDLKFVGRTQILRKNYRTTHEIWQAVKQLAPAAEDAETLDTEPVYHGVPPTFVKYTGMDVLGPRLNRFIFEAMRDERVGPDSVAILCPTSTEMDDVLKVIDPKYRPKKMVSKNLAIDYTGVTVTTMHASKGLGFPIVVIFGVNDGRLPCPPARYRSGGPHRPTAPAPVRRRHKSDEAFAGRRRRLPTLTVPRFSHRRLLGY